MESIAVLLNHRPRPIVSSRETERGQLLTYFRDKINAGRVGTKYRPVSIPRIAKMLETIPTKDLYYLKRICEDSRSFSARFFWELNPQNHGSLTNSA
jgi:hypothetical protein